MKNILLILTTIFSTLSHAEFLPKSFSAQFDQEYVSTLRGKIKKGEGTIDYLYPGKIKFKTSLPSEVTFVSNGTKTWYYRAPFIEGEEGEVTESSAKEGTGIFTKFFDSLNNGLNTNKLYSVVKNELDCKLTFTEKAKKEIGIKEAILIFKKPKNEFSSLKSIELVFPDDKKSSIFFKEIKINLIFEEKFFLFSPPPKTKKV